MPDEFNIVDEEKLAVIKSYDDVTNTDIRHSIQQIIKSFNEKRINKVLVDTTLQKGLPNYLQIYELSEELPHGIKMALITKPDQLTLETLRFFELTSSNKGKLMKIFDSGEKARIWLSEND